MTLRGLGTGMVESVLHYVIRLAWTTGLSNRQLVAGLTDLDQRTAVASLLSSASLCGPGQLYLHALSLLECATGQYTLRHGSYWVLDQVLDPREFNRSSTKRRWCPQCYANWDTETSYEALIWSIHLVERCIKHKCRLLDACSRCGASQQYYVRYDARRDCRACEAPLSDGAEFVTPSASMEWVESQVSDLVRMCATPGQEQILPEAWRMLIGALHKTVLSTAGVQRSLVRDVEILRGSARKSRPTLRTMLNIAALQGQSLSQILGDPSAANSAPLLDIWRHYKYLPLPRMMGPDKPQRAALCLSETLTQQSGGYLPPMGTAFFKRFNVLGTVVVEAYPELTAQYEAAYEAQGSKRWRFHLRDAYRVATRHIQAVRKRTGTFPNQQDLVRHVGREYSFRHSTVLPVCRTALFAVRLVERVRQLPEAALPPLPDSLGWQRGCGIRPL